MPPRNWKVYQFLALCGAKVAFTHANAIDAVTSPNNTGRGMATEPISRFFERLGFKLRNDRSSWGGTNNNAVMLRSWDDEIRSSPRRVIVLVKAERLDGPTQSGRKERKAHLRAVWMGGIPAYTVIVKPKFLKKSKARNIGDFRSDVVFPIERLVEEDEWIFAVLGAPIAAEALFDHMQSHRVEANAAPLPHALSDSSSRVPTAVPKGRSRIDWSDEELQAAVASYTEMMRLDVVGTPYVKAHYYRQLAKQFGRDNGAFERRMQNISYLLDARGLRWLQGLKPQKNVGANVEPRLVGFLRELFAELTPPQTFPEDIGDPSGVIEGAKKQIVVNAYERDATAKPRCIKRWGCVCVVCDFDFHAVYGDLGKDFIHVHHLRPIHTIGEEYVLDPENDLRPVCPNCHSMLHRKKDVLSIEELVGHLKLRFSY